MLVESQPGPSRCQPSRRGYCGYCRILYSNLDQHLSSPKHLDSVQASSRGFSTTSQSHSNRAKLYLLERFLQDVQQHHPHLYKDLRPSHADLPFVSTPPSPKEELDELCSSNNDSRSLGTREHLPSSDDASCQLTSQQEEDYTHSQSGQGLTEEVTQERASAPTKEQEEGESTPTGYMYSTHAQTSPLHMQAPLPVHRKAHRKTNRRKTSDSSSSPPPHRGSDFTAPSELRPWLGWQRERREAQKKEAFSSDHTDPVGQTIEEVIQMCCYGISSAVCQQEETESIHFSLPGSMETQSDDWDSPVQVVLQQRQTLDGKVPSHTPVLVTQMEEQDVSNLMDTQVDLEDQVYSYRLDSALNSKQHTGGGARKDEGFWTLPVDEVLPAPAYIPEAFRGKSWAQIEQEDEEKVDKLVQQFREERFICYFDSESLARYGRRSKNKKGCGKNNKVESDTGILPLLDCDKDDSAFTRRRRRKRRAFRVASRCQVVKVSHSTQTVRLVVPAVRQLPSEAPPPSVPAASQDSAERTPDVQTWQCLPSSYLQIITPLQPHTTLVYLLCSPSGSSPTYTSAPKRCRRKRRPLDLQGFKFRYKQLPVRFYDPSSNQILKNLPKGVVLRRGSSPPPPCVRQLFRSLSPDLNTDRQPGEGTAGSSRVKGRRSEATFSHSFHPSTLSLDSAQTDKQGAVRRRGGTSQAPSTLLHGRAEHSMEARNKPCPPASKRRTRAQATPTQPRREGLRRAGPDRRAPSSTGPPQPLSPCRGRTRKGRGSEKSQR